MLQNDSTSKTKMFMAAGAVLLCIVLNSCSRGDKPAFEGQKAIFGDAKSEIYYDSAKTSVEDVNKLGNILLQSGFFTDENEMIVHLDMLEEVMVVTFQIEEEYWETEEVTEYFAALKNDLQEIFEREVKVVLQSEDLGGKVKEKEF